MSDAPTNGAVEETWEQLEAERRDILKEMAEKYGSFDEAPEELTRKFIDISHRARLMVKPAGKPAADPSKRKGKGTPKTLDELEL